MNWLFNKNQFVSIIIPVYNSSHYLPKAIQSILIQNYKNFEAIFIDDKSIDGSIEIISEYARKDSRIRLIVNNTREGIAKSLMIGLAAAKGNFIARMDADDISVPERISKQIDFINSHPKCDIVCSYIMCINEGEIKIGEWKTDRKTIQPENIKNSLARENCIAHSTIFARKEIFHYYTYNPLDTDAEDYGLWLRLAADGYQFCKIPKPLVYYRIHKKSITSLSKSSNPYKKVLNVKIRFLKERIRQRKFSWFEFRVAFFLLNDLISFAKYWFYKD